MLLSRNVRRQLAALGSSEGSEPAAEVEAKARQAEVVVPPVWEMPVGRETKHSLGSYLSIRLTPAEMGD